MDREDVEEEMCRRMQTIVSASSTLPPWASNLQVACSWTVFAYFIVHQNKPYRTSEPIDAMPRIGLYHFGPLVQG